MMREEVEVCPNCDSENVIQWDVEQNGYKVECKHCGEEMMLCDACYHSEDNEMQFCDWSENGCWRSRTVDILLYKDTVAANEKSVEDESDDNLMLIRIYEWCIRKYVTEICNANYNKWIKYYTADDTEGLFDFIIMNNYKYELLSYENEGVISCGK